MTPSYSPRKTREPGVRRVPVAAIRLYNPTARGTSTGQETAARLRLNGIRIGVLENGKQNARDAMVAMVDELAQRHGVTLSVVLHKEVAVPASPEAVEELAATSDLVLVGSGD